MTSENSSDVVSEQEIAAAATDRNSTIAAIKAALKRRSGNRWSVTGGTGTAWGWIDIKSMPSKRGEFGRMTPEDCRELAGLLGLPTVFGDGVQIAASSEYRREYIERAEGFPVTKKAEPYWD